MKKNKSEILEELDKAFGKYKFFPEDHHYELNGKRVGISVTKFIEQYANEFNAELIARKVAEKEWKTVQEVLDEWKYKNEFACTKGSTSHEFTQSLWSGEEYTPTYFDNSEEFKNAVGKIRNQAINFHKDYSKEFIHVADEYVIGSEEYDIASAVDHLFMTQDSKGNTQLFIIDYKTNTYITGYNKEAYYKQMKAPLQHLNDDKFTHYKLQLSIYRYIIEKYTTLKISDMMIVYMSEINDNYEVIRIPYLKQEVEDILEWRKYE